MVFAPILIAFAALASAGTPLSCPTNPPTSCQNTTVQQDLCCFNSPGGLMVQTQFWDYSPSTGPVDSWTVHGLWPDHCDATYDSNCDAARAYTGIGAALTQYGKQSTLDYMNIYWKDYQGNDESFWEHEWSKHGTCISTLNPTCYTNYASKQEAADYFEKAVNLFKTLPSYTWLSNAGIVPSNTATYTSSQIQTALSNGFGHPVVIRCSSGNLNEVWYYYNVKGSVATGTFVPVNPVSGSSNCPSTGIKYVPKSGSSGGGTGIFTGSGYLNVNQGGSQKGCLISAGTWYVSGTCATYTATASGSGFTLTSSKGKCAISGGVFTCSSSISTGTVFTASNGKLVNGAGTTFYASAVAAGTTQQTVYTSSHSVSLEIVWQQNSP